MITAVYPAIFIVVETMAKIIAELMPFIYALPVTGLKTTLLMISTLPITALSFSFFSSISGIRNIEARFEERGAITLSYSSER